MKTNFSGCAVLLLLLVAARVPSAQAKRAFPECGSNPECESLFKQARAQSGIGNLDEAFRLYTRAYAVEADPDLLFSIARVLQKQGNTVAAVVYYRKFLRSPSQAAEQRRIAQEYLRQFADAGPPIAPKKPERSAQPVVPKAPPNPPAPPN